MFINTKILNKLIFFITFSFIVFLFSLNFNFLNLKTLNEKLTEDSKDFKINSILKRDNSFSTFHTIPKWNGAYQNVFNYTEDITISKISTGWYEAKNLFFNKIEVNIVNGSNIFTQIIDFNLVEDKSIRNIKSFSMKLAEVATKSTKYLFGKKLEKMELNLTGDTRFIFQHLNASEKYSDVAPITLGDISYHDPRYNGHLIFSSDHNYVKFNDVLNQRNDCGGYSDQCRSDFSQNTNTWYKLTTNVTGRNNYHYLAPNTWNVRDKIYQKHSNYNDNCFILNFQVDVWLVKNIWYVGFFWINSITNH